MFSAAITLLRNTHHVVPLAAPAHVHLVSVTEDPDPYTGEALGDVLRSHAWPVTVSKVWNGSCKDSADQLITHARSSDVIVLGVYLSIGAWKGQLGFSDELEKLIKRIGELNKPVITIAFGDPYVLGKLPPTDGVIATYTGQREAEEAVGRALIGTAEIGGRLPVTIPGQFKRGDGIHMLPAHPLGK
jgi:beta-N-acetylhexosaminidase